MNDIKTLLTNLSDASVQLDHEDVTKCGHCWRRKIQSEVANEFLAAGKLSPHNLKEMFEEVENRWNQTELFLRVQEMLKTGMSIENVETKLKEEGIEI